MVTGKINQASNTKRYYDKNKKLGLCVKCSKKSLEDSIMCGKHLRMARIAGQRARDKKKLITPNLKLNQRIK